MAPTRAPAARRQRAADERRAPPHPRRLQRPGSARPWWIGVAIATPIHHTPARPSRCHAPWWLGVALATPIHLSPGSAPSAAVRGSGRPVPRDPLFAAHSGQNRRESGSLGRSWLAWALLSTATARPIPLGQRRHPGVGDAADGRPRQASVRYAPVIRPPPPSEIRRALAVTPARPARLIGAESPMQDSTPDCHPDAGSNRR